MNNLFIILILSIVLTSVFGENCGKTVHRRDGTFVQLVYLHCPGSRDHQDAEFCCGNERRHRCCTAEELMSHRNSDYVKFNDRPGVLEILGEQQINNSNPNQNAESGVGEKCEKTINRPDGTLIKLDFLHCPDYGDSKDSLYCCGNKWHPHCCTAEELRKQGQIVETHEETAQRENDEMLLKNLQEKTAELDRILKAQKSQLTNMDIESLPPVTSNPTEEITTEEEEVETTTPLPEIKDEHDITVFKKIIRIPLTQNKPTAIGEVCGKTIHRLDGSIYQTDFKQCPGERDRKNALFCCGIARNNRCCSAEDLRRHGKVIVESSVPLFEPLSQVTPSSSILSSASNQIAPIVSDQNPALNQITPSSSISSNPNPALSEITPSSIIPSDQILEADSGDIGELQTCNEGHSRNALIKLCSRRGGSRKLQHCCKHPNNQHGHCCTEDEYEATIRVILEMENAARRKDIVVKVLGASLFVFAVAVLLSWYCCVHVNRKRGYQLVGVYEPLLKEAKEKQPPKYTLYYNVEQPSETLKNSYV